MSSEWDEGAGDMTSTSLMPESSTQAANPSSLASAESTAHLPVKMRVHNLPFPSTFDIVELRHAMQYAQNIHVWCERPVHRMAEQKLGGVSLVFDCEQDARSAFEHIQCMTKKCYGLKIQAPRHFYEPQVSSVPLLNTAIDENDPLMECKLVAYQLLPSVEQHVLTAIFDEDQINHITLVNDHRRHDGSKLAIIEFSSAEAMQVARADFDEFPIDDGDTKRHMRLLTLHDYIRMVKHNATAPKQSEKQQQSTNQEREAENSNLAPQVDKQETEVEDAPLHTQTAPQAKTNENREQKEQIEEHSKTDVIGDEQVVVNPSEADQPDNDNQMDEENEGNAVKMDQTDYEHTQHSPNEKCEERAGAEMAEEQLQYTGDEQPIIEGHDSNSQDSTNQQDTTDAAANQNAAFTPEDIGGAIDELMTSERMNWAEQETVPELWKILDRVSHALGWVADHELRAGMMHSLKKNLQETHPSWLQTHLQNLIRTWKREMVEGQNKQRSDRDYPLAAPEYQPPVQMDKPKPKETKERKRAVLGLMGIGAMLANAREMYQEEPQPEEEAPVEPVAAAQESPSKRQKKRKRSPHTPEGDSPDDQSQSPTHGPGTKRRRTVEEKLERKRAQCTKLHKKLKKLKRKRRKQKGRDGDGSDSDSRNKHARLEDGEMSTSGSDDEEDKEDKTQRKRRRDTMDSEQANITHDPLQQPDSSNVTGENEKETKDSSSEWSSSDSELSEASAADPQVLSDGSSSAVLSDDNEKKVAHLKARERRRTLRERARKRLRRPDTSVQRLVPQMMSMMAHMYECRLQLFRTMPHAQRIQLMHIFSQVRSQAPVSEQQMHQQMMLVAQR